MAISEYISALGEVLTGKADSIFIAPALPRRLRITEVDIDVCRYSEVLVSRHLGAAIPSQGFVELLGTLHACLIKAVVTLCVSLLAILANISKRK